jgi:hypothetical protein
MPPDNISPLLSQSKLGLITLRSRRFQENKMPAWRMGLLGAALCCGAGFFTSAALAQEMSGVNGGVNSDNGVISGPNINRVNGINANGTPRQQDPGASMTNGAGNSTMTPGVTGPVGGNSGLSTPKTVPPTVILHNNEQSSGSP